MAKQFLLLFVGTFFIAQFVLMMQFLWRYVDELIGKGLSLDVLGEFFWYMALMLVPQALPLAILLSSLITFGNLGESSELTAIKAAGISLMKSFRSLIVIAIIICGASFYFQNNVGPQANMKLTQLLISMKQKSPELEIAEGVFNSGIPNCNIFVEHKDMETGKLYNVIIYRMTGSYEDQAIILADSAMLQSTKDKKHLRLSLWSGEWFENMSSQELNNNAAVPYRRETFSRKTILLDFDSDFSLTDAALLSNNARGKSLSQIRHDVDSLNHEYDSIGQASYKEMRGMYYKLPSVDEKRMTAFSKLKDKEKIVFDSIYNTLSETQKRSAVAAASASIQNANNELEFRSYITKDSDKLIRQHQCEGIGKFTLALSCLIFFFIGAPLGAIIRKGGLGVPVIISVLVFIVYYILDNSGTRMAKLGAWPLWFGCSLATAVLSPLAFFVTYKANNDSVVFNKDAYVSFFRKLFGIASTRHISGKEVIITDPDYASCASRLAVISEEINEYAQEHKLYRMPNVIKVFFRYSPDHVIESINTELEEVIEELGNSRDKHIIAALNDYPVMATKAHTRPFDHKWMNIMAAIIVPVGIFLYLRMWRFRLRLYRNLVVTKQTNEKLIKRINKNINIYNKVEK